MFAQKYAEEEEEEACWRPAQGREAAARRLLLREGAVARGQLLRLEPVTFQLCANGQLWTPVDRTLEGTVPRGLSP